MRYIPYKMTDAEQPFKNASSVLNSDGYDVWASGRKQKL